MPSATGIRFITRSASAAFSAMRTTFSVVAAAFSTVRAFVKSFASAVNTLARAVVPTTISSRTAATTNARWLRRRLGEKPEAMIKGKGER